MKKELNYPFDSSYIMKKRKKIKKELLAEYETENNTGMKKKIAVLGGSTTHDVKDMLELFLLNQGIVPQFYESEYAQWLQDVMFDNPELLEFEPDIIYIHTSSRNIVNYPSVRSSEKEIEEMASEEFQRFEAVWKKIEERFHCPVIQNNFELPFYRLLGNRDASDYHGRVNYVNRLNDKFYQWAREHKNFYINDIHYLSACYGLQKWSDTFSWHMYKYACAVSAIPELAFNVGNIIKSIYGKNKKGFVLDLDNTLWGGIVGDDGADNIEIGQETSNGQLYAEFQKYIKEHKDLGVLLNVASKNEEENALAGLSRPDSVLKPEDFVVIKANWDPKDRNIVKIAEELNIGVDSLVFVDDNPAERHIVQSQIGGIGVPEMISPETYIYTIDRSGFFEVTNFSEDDLKRNEMYAANAERRKQEASFENYEEYLLSMDMKAEIKPFSSIYMSRIAQLTNKSNQFNLTTRRCSQAELEQISANASYITLYGKLEDKFGDNGVVSVVFGHREDKVFHIDLWLMSCRVLKRNMEFAMMDELVGKCLEGGIEEIRGYYYPTAKNKMVKDFYALQGFTLVQEDESGNAVWSMFVNHSYEKKNKVIEVYTTI